MRKHNISGESTVTKKRANRKLTLGIDVGDRSSRYCILEEQGEVLAEGSVATTKKGLAQVFGSKPRSRVALEGGRILAGSVDISRLWAMKSSWQMRAVYG